MTVVSWSEIGAVAINGAGVMILLKVVNEFLPVLRARVPQLLPILAGALGPVLALAQGYLSTWLGVPIDLSPLDGVFGGTLAVTVHQVYQQHARVRHTGAWFIAARRL